MALAPVLSTLSSQQDPLTQFYYLLHDTTAQIPGWDLSVLIKYDK